MSTSADSLDDHRLDLCRRLRAALRGQDADEVWRFVSELLELEEEG